MACLVFTVSERGRNNFGRLGAVLCLLLLLLGLTIAGMALFIRAHIQTKLQLLDNYNGSGFIYFLLVCGLMVAIVYTMGMKIFLDLGSYDTRYRWESQTRLYGLIIAVVMFTVFCCIIVVFTHRITMKKYFETGLKTAMDQYAKSADIKRTIDTMQLQFQCCGSKEPQDWFAIPWIDIAYLDLKATAIKRGLKNGVYKGDHVPFSCCSVKVTRPCIHRHVMNNDSHAGYSWPKDSTLSAVGCVAALAAEFGKTILNVAGSIVIATFLLMAFSLVILKLLSTAIANTYPWGDPEGEAPTWMVETCPTGLCNSETPEPPDDLSVIVPGAKGLGTKKKVRRDTEERVPDDDDESLDGDDTPLLNKVSDQRIRPTNNDNSDRPHLKLNGGRAAQPTKAVFYDDSDDDTDRRKLRGGISAHATDVEDEENVGSSGGDGSDGGDSEKTSKKGRKGTEDGKQNGKGKDKKNDRSKSNKKRKGKSGKKSKSKSKDRKSKEKSKSKSKSKNKKSKKKKKSKKRK